MQGKGIKIATVLEIIAEEASESKLETLQKLSKILIEKEMLRQQLTQRIQSLSIEPLVSYPIIYDNILNGMKQQKNAVHEQKKRREAAENIMLKESGELGNIKSSKIVNSVNDSLNLSLIYKKP